MKNSENKLFIEWENVVGNDFAINGGLLFRGDFSLHEPYDGYCKWKRQEGNEEELWKNSKVRIMILTKDLNDEECSWDIRQENCGRKDVPENQRCSPVVKYLDISLYRKLKRWVYGLLKSTCETDIPSFEYVKEHSEELAVYYENAPLVRVNCKMANGKSSVSDTELKRYIARDLEFLIRQIKIYKANVIVCCGNRNEHNIIVEELVKNAYPDLELIDVSEGWVYYSKSDNVLVVDTYHPTSTKHGDEWQYDNFLKYFFRTVKHLDFKFKSLK
jgi:hypothetical protein